MYFSLEFAPSIQRQPLSAGGAWLLWGLLMVIVIGGTGLFLFYKNRQEQEKQKLIAEADHLRDEMEKLWQLSDAMNWSLPIKEALIKMIRAVKKIAGAHRAQIYLLDVSQENLFAIAEEEDLLIVPGFNQVPKSLGRLPIVFDRIEPVIIEDLLKPHPDDVVLPEVINDGNLSLIVIPLNVEREILGIMGIYFDYYVDWSKEKVELFSSIGRMIGKNLKNAKNAENLRELAILQERKHFSQELHDNFSQLTSALSLRAEAARLSLEEGNLEKTQHDLERIIDTAHEVQLKPAERDDRLAQRDRMRKVISCRWFRQYRAFQQLSQFRSPGRRKNYPAGPGPGANWVAVSAHSAGRPVQRAPPFPGQPGGGPDQSYAATACAWRSKTTAAGLTQPVSQRSTWDCR